ncbi:MAG: hypothetical protein AB7F40_02150 [Victivallaceae bacterium]
MMPNGEIPDHRDLWEAVNQARLELAEMKGMLKMHFEDSKHHYPPCKPAADLQKTMLSAMGAAVLALIAAIGNIVMEFVRR